MKAFFALSLAFQLLFTLLRRFDIALHFARAYATRVNLAVILVIHMMNVSDYLVSAHLANADRFAQIGNARADPAAFGNVIALPKVFALRKLFFQSNVYRVFRLFFAVRLVFDGLEFGNLYLFFDFEFFLRIIRLCLNNGRLSRFLSM